MHLEHIVGQKSLICQIMDGDNRTIFVACEKGSLDELQRLIAAGHDVDAKNMIGYRSVHLAALNGNQECLQYLLDLPEVDPNWTSFEDETALILAAMHGHTDCLQCLLQKNADPNICNNLQESPLLKAVENGHLCGVQLLLKYGADPNKRQYSGCTPLHSAVNENNLTLVKLLLQSGADVGLTDEYNLTPIFIASQFGFCDCLNVLVAEAKEKNQEDLVNTSAKDGATPLYLAAQNGHADCVDLLLKAGADANKIANSPRAVALYAALQFNHLDCVQLLLPRTDSKVYAKCDATPFEIAASSRCGSVEILQYLVDHIENYHIDTLQYMDSDSFTYRLFPGEGYKVNSMTATSLASMIMSGYQRRLIEIMLKAGASPNCSQSIGAAKMLNSGATPDSFPVRHLLSDSLPPIIADCENDGTEILNLLVEYGADPNIYSPSVHYNLTVLFSLQSSKRLGLLLRKGAETTSCFHSSDHSSQPSREQYSGFFSSNVENGNAYIIPASFIEVLAHCDKHSASGISPRTDILIKLLLEFTTSPGYISEIIDLIRPGCDRDDILRIMNSPSSLAHSCRVKIRECLTYRNLHRKVLLELLNLPTIVSDFILYEGDFDTVTELINAESKSDPWSEFFV